MKIIGFAYNNRQKSKQQILDSVFVAPDSAILHNNRPFFLPDFSQSFRSHASLAIRISRLGKNIDAKFASRYYDAATIAIHTIADKSVPGVMANCFDGSVMLGEFIAPDSFENLSYKIVLESGEELKGSVNDLALNIDEIVAEVSRYFTMKMGDIILVGNGDDEYLPAIGDALQGYLNCTVAGELKQEKIFNFRIK